MKDFHKGEHIFIC